METWILVALGAIGGMLWYGLSQILEEARRIRRAVEAVQLQQAGSAAPER